jgi:hypothetical protein
MLLRFLSTLGGVMTWFRQLSTEVRLIVAISVIAVVGMAVLAGCGSSSKKPASSEAKSHVTAQEGREAEEEAFGNPRNPDEPRSLEEMIVANPHNEVATEEQLKRQIITNEESSDPTNQQEASCSYLSEYGHYLHYICEGYTLGGQNSAIGQIEVTVNQNNGEVLVEEE